MLFIVVDSNLVNPITINGKVSNADEFNERFLDIVDRKKIDVNKFEIQNKNLRAVKRIKGYEYHVLEQPAGITPIYCIGGNGRRKKLQIKLPYTVLIVKFVHLNGQLHRKTERLYFADKPVAQNLDNRLYRWSLSNVYDDGNICWGSSDDGSGLPTVDINSSYKFLNEFFLGTKNYDLMPNKGLFNWVNMSEDVVYEARLKDTKRISFNLSDAFNMF